MFNTLAGAAKAEAASRYGSGSNQKMRLLEAEQQIYKTFSRKFFSGSTLCLLCQSSVDVNHKKT
jgi:hypothetical protein